MWKTKYNSYRISIYSNCNLTKSKEIIGALIEQYFSVCNTNINNDIGQGQRLKWSICMLQSDKHIKCLNMC